MGNDQVRTKDLGSGVILFTVPGRDISKINQKKLWEKAGAKVIEASKDDRAVVVDVPDEKTNEILQKFSQLLSRELEDGLFSSH